MMAQKNGKNTFIMDYDYQAFFDSLSDEEAGKLIKAVFRYEIQEQRTDLPVNIEPLFIFICNKLDQNKKKYQKKCDQNRDNINQRWKKGDNNPLDNM